MGKVNRKLKAKIIEQFGSQIDFAEQAKVDPTMVSMIVRNRRELAEGEKTRWAKLLEMEPEELWP